MSVELLVASLQHRFGHRTLRRACDLPGSRATLPTGVEALDELLDGGLLRGATHQFAGQATSGATSLLYRAVANAQAQGLPVIYLDMALLFDPPTAAAAGVDIERLLLLRETALQNALFLIRQLAQQRLPCLLALDYPAALPLTQLKPILRDAPLTLLALTPKPLDGLQVVLRCFHEDWHLRDGDVTGFRSGLHLLAHPFLPRRRRSMCFPLPKEEAHV